jgi:C4-type Zn-finger protein
MKNNKNEQPKFSVVITDPLGNESQHSSTFDSKYAAKRYAKHKVKEGESFTIIKLNEEN